MAHLTEILRPSGNANSLWSTNSYLNIDDVVQSPTDGDNSTIVADTNDDDELQRYQMTNASGDYSSITRASLFVRGLFSAGAKTVPTSIMVSGNWQASQNMSFTAADTWFKSDFDLVGSPTIASFDDTEIRFNAGTISGKSDELEIDAAYIVVSGTLQESSPSSLQVYPSRNINLFDTPIMEYV